MADLIDAKIKSALDAMDSADPIAGKVLAEIVEILSRARERF